MKSWLAVFCILICKYIESKPFTEGKQLHGRELLQELHKQLLDQWRKSSYNFILKKIKKYQNVCITIERN